MDNRPTTAESKHHHYQSSPWSPAPTNLGTPRQNSTSPPVASTSPPHLPSQLDFLPVFFPQQSSLFQAQLLHYNKLVSPGRGGGGGAPQAQPPHTSLSSSLSPPSLSASRSNKNGSRSRSSSKVSNKDSPLARPGPQSCHGNKLPKNHDTADRASITTKGGKDAAIPLSKMPGKKQHTDSSANPPPTPSQPQKPGSHPPSHPRSVTQPAPNASAASTLSSSVPSTPHQYARKFSFESREPSPGANQNHSPRSAYSETNSTLPSLRPLPPRLGGCPFETAPAYSRRRMNYNIGSDKLDRVDLATIKSKLSEDEDRKLTTDMRELYNRLLPTRDIEKNRQKLVSKLEKLFNDEWPGHDIRVHLFGSSGNLLCSDDSDVDICITTEWKELEGVCMIADLLSKHGMEKVVCVSSAKVPIVKIWDPELGLACDMNVNNTLALENTRMVRTYVDLDERVRPLAMIIKYWTRKRIVNDAAFGGTLSSYTWICMIIAFLQLRSPPILPALHQQRHKLVTKDGTKSAFADDIEKLRGFGSHNKEQLGELLFQFFRFYAHEFDFDKFALSVRLGKLITKTEKKWHLALNNCLCVEEPFNIVRNLGNTADDTSFRGLHLELRRAFDLIAEGKLGDCCEQYVFPKEEERIWQKPAPVPKPILVRSSSQQHSGRGGRGGYRGGRPFHRNNNNNNNNNNGGNNSRRTSSNIAYDANAAFTQPGVQPMTPQEAQFLWYQAQQHALQQDILGTTLSALQAQGGGSLPFHMYTQHALQQQQALAHAQRMQSGNGGNGSGGGGNGGSSQTTDRSRTNSFDNPPLTAPLRPEMAYIYPYFPSGHYFAQPIFAAYPQNPSSTNTTGAAPEPRRSLHRSNVTTDSGALAGSGALRSQSQPASRPSMPSSQGMPGHSASAQPSTLPTFPSRQAHGGVPIPSFIPDEANETDFDDAPTKASAANSTPEPDEGPRYVGFYVNEATSLGQQKPNGTTPATAIPTFGDLARGGQGRRRLSTDQLPQSILDRRMKRTSRSPSPLGHARAFSVGTSSAPLSSAPFPPSGTKLSATPGRSPLVVNGTAATAANGTTGTLTGSKPNPNPRTPHHPSGSDSVLQHDDSAGYDNPLRINQAVKVPGSRADRTPSHGQAPTDPNLSTKDRPVVVNGSTSNYHSPAPLNYPDPQSFGHRVATMGGFNTACYPLPTGEGLPDVPRISPNGRSRTVSRQQQNGIAPLDLATSEFTLPQGFQHLSPVYEHRASPSEMARGVETQPHNEKPLVNPKPTSSRENRADSAFRPTPKSPSSQTPAPNVMTSKIEIPSSGSSAVNTRVNGIAARENGHTRGTRSDGEAVGPWQRSKNRKKGVADLKGAANGLSHGEPLPKNDADRKGG